MVTLQDINQFAATHNLGSGTDIFSLLSMMQLDVRKTEVITPSVPSPTPSKVEFTTQDLLELFS